MRNRPDFLNFNVDHMTLLLHPQMYRIAYVAFRIIFGCTPQDLLYEKRRAREDGEVSMTYAQRLGTWRPPASEPLSTIVAVVQPSEPPQQPSHVRDMLGGPSRAAHWQHIALRTPDLMKFYTHAQQRGVQFITPILRDAEENLIQAFTGEWYLPGLSAPGVFFEFLQREPSDAALAAVQQHNKQSWFRDETFLGLYNEKEREYRSGHIQRFFSDAVLAAITAALGGKQIWEISEADLLLIEAQMLELTAKQPHQGPTM